MPKFGGVPIGFLGIAVKRQHHENFRKAFASGYILFISPSQWHITA
jgi:hypothetical protein